MKNQRLRNLTTGKLHTKMDDIYQDVEFITGEKGVMTHNLPNAVLAMRPWLREKAADARFWDGQLDLSHQGETALSPMTQIEQAEFWKRFQQLPHPFEKLGEDRVVTIIAPH